MIRREDTYRELLSSEGWALFKREVVDEVYDNIQKQLAELTPENASYGPVYAGQLKVLNRVLRNLYDAADKETE